MNIGDRVRVRLDGLALLPGRTQGRSGTIKQCARETGNYVVALDPTPEQRANIVLVPPDSVLRLVERQQERMDIGRGAYDYLLELANEKLGVIQARPLTQEEVAEVLELPVAGLADLQCGRISTVRFANQQAKRVFNEFLWSTIDAKLPLNITD